MHEDVLYWEDYLLLVIFLSLAGALTFAVAPALF